jgi:hypothetical protein
VSVAQHVTAILVKTPEGRTVIIETGDDPKIISAAGGRGTTANAAEKVLDRLKDVGDAHWTRSGSVARRAERSAMHDAPSRAGRQCLSTTTRSGTWILSGG